jgi:hypothetical protein
LNTVGSSRPLLELASQLETLSVVIEVGRVPVRINTSEPEFLRMLEERYAGFITVPERAEIEFDVEIVPPGSADPDADVKVTQREGRWKLTRGDFRAEWEPASGRGRIQQSANPYSIDSVLRIVHTLVLARDHGLLLHAASAIRNGKAFLFAGVSGAGKTTISRLAPADVILLTDEISYVRREGAGYIAFGTPFAGELAKVGENVFAPVEALYLLAKGPENRIETVPSGEAARSLLANLLFFAKEEHFVQAAFHAAFEFVSRIPVLRLTFAPDSRVWELIG